MTITPNADGTVTIVAQLNPKPNLSSTGKTFLLASESDRLTIDGQDVRFALNVTVKNPDFKAA
jgi:hypothetical protein